MADQDGAGAVTAAVDPLAALVAQGRVTPPSEPIPWGTDGMEGRQYTEAEIDEAVAWR